MEQNKYIPGDWVIDKMDLPPGYVQIKQISETFGKETLILKSGWAVYSSEVEPIPLTPEILEGIGWKWSEEHEEFASSSSKIAIYPESNYYVISDLYVKIRYAHQLQHFLFGLGLDSNFDLTDTKKGVSV